MNQNKMMSTTIGISGMGPGGEEVFLPFICVVTKKATLKYLPMELGRFNCIRRTNMYW